MKLKELIIKLLWMLWLVIITFVAIVLAILLKVYFKIKRINMGIINWFKGPIEYQYPPMENDVMSDEEEIKYCNAKCARNITDNIQRTVDIKKAMEKINKCANEGKSEVSFFASHGGLLMPEAVSKLETLGYKVRHSIGKNHNFHDVNW